MCLVEVSVFKVKFGLWHTKKEKQNSLQLLVREQHAEMVTRRGISHIWKYFLGTLYKRDQFQVSGFYYLCFV